MPAREHWHIACIEVAFLVPVPGAANDEQAPGELRVNVMIRSDDQKLKMEILGRAQQSAQMQAAEKIGQQEIQFMAATFLSITYLGHMTEREFNSKTPVRGSNDA